MQNPILKSRQSSIVFEKPSVFSGKLKTLMSSNCHKVRYFLLKLRTRFSYLLMPIKGCSGFFLKFCLDLELFAKIKKTWFLRTRFYIFINN